MINRDYKFRAWDTKSKRWWTHEETLSLLLLQGRNRNGTAHSDGKKHIDRYAINQYTGRDGKDGVGIYEDDLIQWLNTDSHCRFDALLSKHEGDVVKVAENKRTVWWYWKKSNPLHVKYCPKVTGFVLGETRTTNWQDGSTGGRLRWQSKSFVSVGNVHEGVNYA